MKGVYTAIFCIVSALVFSQVPAAGLIGAWPFNGNAVDVSGTGNDGTVFGATLTSDRCGNVNSAYRFNGINNYIRMLFAGPTGTLSRSISFWARTTNTVINSPKVTFEYGGNSGVNDCYQVVWNFCGPGVGLSVGAQSLIRGNNCLLNNSWHHIVIVFNPSVSLIYSNVSFYIDGVLQPVISCFTTGITASINTGIASPVTIGRNANASNRFWSGDLDDFYLYNRPLTFAEVLQLYTACPPPVAGNTLACTGATVVYSIAPISNASYVWSLPGGWTGTSTTNTISAVVNNAGTLSVTATSTCGTFGPSTLSVGILSLPVLSITSTNTTICAGTSATLSVFGANTYTWVSPVSSASSIVVSPLVTTVYTVTGRNTVTGCLGTNTLSLGVIASPTLVPTSTGSLACVGNTASLSATGALSYTWLPINVSNSVVTVSPLATTIFTLRGLNLAGCIGSSTINVLVPAAMTISVSAGSASVCPGAGVILTATSSGGPAPFSYSWTSGPLTNTYAATSMVGGNVIYTITSMNANNCQAIRTTTVFFFNPVNLTVADKSVCPGILTTFTVSGAATYTWLPGMITGNSYSLIPVGASIYTVTGTSINGCTASATPSIDIRPVPIVSFVNTTITCASLGTSTVIAVGGQGPNSYLWNPSAQTSSVGSNLISGIYTVSVIDNGTGCTTVGTTTLDPIDPFTGTVSATSSLVCNGLNTGTASIALNGGSGNRTYFWSNPAGGQSQASATVLSAGVHTVIVTDVVTACTVTQTFQITQPAPFFLTAVSSTSQTCVNNNVILSVTGAGGSAPYTFSWTAGPAANFYITTSSVGANPIYTISAIDTNSCPATTTISLLFTDIPSLTVNSPTICAGQTATLTASGAQSYLWYPGGFAGSSVNMYPLSSRIYTVVGVTLGCQATTTVFVKVNPLPMPVVNSNNNVCEGFSIILSTANIGTYLWTGPASFTSSNQNPVINAVNFNNHNGIYSLFFTDLNGCSASTSTFVSVLINPVISISEASVCIGEAATLSVSGAASYFWNGPNTYTAVGAQVFIPQVTAATVGNYTVFGTGANFCVTSTIVTLTGYPYPLPTPSISSLPNACIQSTVVMRGSGGSSYLWSGPGNLNSTSATLNFSPDNVNMSGIYTLTVKNTSNCAASTTVMLRVYALPSATLLSNKNNICVPFCAQFSLKVSPNNIAPVKGFYFINNAGLFTDSTLTSCFAKGEDKMMQVNYIDTNNCVNSSTLIVNANPKPVADFQFYPTEPFTITDRVSFINLSSRSHDNEFTWHFSKDEAVVKLENPFHVFDLPDNYPVVLIVKNGWGCEDTIVRNIIVTEELSLFVPNSFTPNNDGKNDVFQPKGVGISKYNLDIFDRWGHKVFNTSDFNQPWDALINGEPCKEDTYIWTIDVTGISGKERKYNGLVNVLR